MQFLRTCYDIVGNIFLGEHPTGLSYEVTAKMLRDWTRMRDIALIYISKDRTPRKTEEELPVKDLIRKHK